MLESEGLKEEREPKESVCVIQPVGGPGSAPGLPSESMSRLFAQRQDAFLIKEVEIAG